MTISRTFRSLLNAFAVFAIFAALAPFHARLARADLTFEEDFSLPVVYFNLLVDSGASYDPAEKLGLANVASHMLLRGTQKHGKSEFFSLLNRIGGELEVEVRSEGVIYRAAVLADNADKFFDLLTEAFTRPKFDASELKKLKQEVISDILERKSNDRALAQYSIQRFFFGSHPYGNPSSGTMKGVAAVEPKDVVDFYANYFGDNTIHLFGSGALKKPTVAKWFGQLEDKLRAMHPGAKSGAAIVKPEIPKTHRMLLVDTPKATQSQIIIAGPGIRPDTPGFYAIELANHSFGGPSFEARLMKEVRVKRGWTYGIGNNFRFGRQPRDYELSMAPKTTDTLPAIELVLGMLNNFVQKGITEQEYHFAQSSLVNNAPFNYDTSKKRLENATTERLLNFPGDYFRDFASNIGKVSFDAITPALHESFKLDAMAIVVVGNASELKEPLSKLKGFEPVVIKNYKED